MDEGTQKRLDAVMEQELQQGYRVKRVPDAIVAEWTRECGTAPARVRFTKINPARRRKIAEVVQRQYHKDLANKDLLSHEQVLKFVTERGEWSTEMQAEMDTLREKTAQEMGLLFMSGDADNTWGTDYVRQAGAFRTILQTTFADDVVERNRLVAIFDRWVEYTPTDKDKYTALYAAEQGRESYNSDSDLQKLYTAMSRVEDGGSILDELDLLRDKLDRFTVLQKQRIRLRELQLRFARIFAETVEQRRDTTDELARMYFTTEAMDKDNVALGPITPKYDAVMELPQTAIEWLLTEAYFVQNNIPDTAREYLETFGFLEAEQAEEKSDSTNGGSNPSVELPAPQISSPVSVPVAVTESAVSASTPAMSLTTPN